MGINSPEVVEAANIGDEVGGAAKLLLPAAATFLTIIKTFRDILDASFNLAGNHKMIQVLMRICATLWDEKRNRNCYISFVIFEI